MWRAPCRKVSGSTPVRSERPPFRAMCSIRLGGLMARAAWKQTENYNDIRKATDAKRRELAARMRSVGKPVVLPPDTWPTTAAVIPDCPRTLGKEDANGEIIVTSDSADFTQSTEAPVGAAASEAFARPAALIADGRLGCVGLAGRSQARSEEHTAELQSPYVI